MACFSAVKRDRVEVLGLLNLTNETIINFTACAWSTQPITAMHKPSEIAYNKDKNANITSMILLAIRSSSQVSANVLDK
jgi:hypothetical protein